MRLPWSRSLPFITTFRLPRSGSARLAFPVFRSGPRFVDRLLAFDGPRAGDFERYLGGEEDRLGRVGGDGGRLDFEFEVGESHRSLADGFFSALEVGRSGFGFFDFFETGGEGIRLRSSRDLDGLLFGAVGDDDLVFFVFASVCSEKGLIFQSILTSFAFFRLRATSFFFLIRDGGEECSWSEEEEGEGRSA